MISRRGGSSLVCQSERPGWLESQADWLARVDSGEIARNGEDSLFGEGCGSLLGGARGRLAAGPFFGLRTPPKSSQNAPLGPGKEPGLSGLETG